MQSLLGLYTQTYKRESGLHLMGYPFSAMIEVAGNIVYMAENIVTRCGSNTHTSFTLWLIWMTASCGGPKLPNSATIKCTCNNRTLSGITKMCLQQQALSFTLLAAANLTSSSKLLAGLLLIAAIVFLLQVFFHVCNNRNYHFHYLQQQFTALQVFSLREVTAFR